MPLPQAVAQLLAPRGTPLPLQVGVGEAPAVPALPTGLPELDALATGGVPRGRLTEVVARRGGGRTTLLRQLVARTIADGGWVAVIDASRTLAPSDWAPAATTGRLWIVRPEDATRAAWCADVLLRSGAFALVVLDAAPPLSRTVAVRLTRLARETGAAFVVAGEPGAGATGTTPLAGALRFRVSAIHARGAPPASRQGRRREREHALNDRTTADAARGAASGRTRVLSSLPAPIRVPAAHDASSTEEGRPRRRETIIAVLVEKGGIHRTVEVSCAIDLSRRLCAHPEVPDRRGVARRASGRGQPLSRPAGGGARDDGDRVGRGGGAAAARNGSGASAPPRLARAAAGGPPPTTTSPDRPGVASSFPRGRRRNLATPDYPPAPSRPRPRPRAGALG